MEETRELTVGEKAVGLNFNPSNDPQVQEIKVVCANLIDMVDKSCDLNNPVNRKIRDCAIQELITAQMWAVKAITWKY